MGSYSPATDSDRAELLHTVGVKAVSDLFTDIPEALKLKEPPDLPPGAGEMELRRQMEALAAENTVFPTVLRGAGAYRHYIPAAVRSIAGKEEFVTAYTPYQAEISQGILQSIFEYQSMICALTGMDASNASVYDGASAAAEAAAMCRDRRRTKVLVSDAAHPDVIAVIRTYAEAAGAETLMIPARDGVTDTRALAGMLDESTACVYIAQPNFFGQIEPAAAIGEAAHICGAKFVMGCNPIALALLRSPAECGADIAVGEGQPLGLPLSYGGASLGFIACTGELLRRLPGRIVGQTTDREGRRSFVLTLQAREQHIRREKAASNLCTNQAHCAMTAAVYMAALGPEGMAEAARQCVSKAHYFARKLCEIPGVRLAFGGEFFHEFVTRIPVPADAVNGALARSGILGGLPAGDGMLWCVTEAVTRGELDRAAEIVSEVCLG